MKTIFLTMFIFVALLCGAQTEYYVDAYGDNTGVSDNGVLITAALASGETVFHFSPGRYKFTTDVVFPQGCALIIDRGALIDARDSITGTYTAIDAGDYQIFTRTSKLYGTWDVYDFPFTWFGANGDSNYVSIELEKACEFAQLTRGNSIVFNKPYLLEKPKDTIAKGLNVIMKPGALFSADTLVMDSVYVSRYPRYGFVDTTVILGSVFYDIDTSYGIASKEWVKEKIVVGDTATVIPIEGRMVYMDADSSIYICRSTTADQKWFKLNE